MTGGPKLSREISIPRADAKKTSRALRERRSDGANALQPARNSESTAAAYLAPARFGSAGTRGDAIALGVDMSRGHPRSPMSRLPQLSDYPASPVRTPNRRLAHHRPAHSRTAGCNAIRRGRGSPE